MYNWSKPSDIKKDLIKLMEKYNLPKTSTLTLTVQKIAKEGNVNVNYVIEWVDEIQKGSSFTFDEVAEMLYNVSHFVPDKPAMLKAADFYKILSGYKVYPKYVEFLKELIQNRPKGIIQLLYKNPLCLYILAKIA